LESGIELIVKIGADHRKPQSSGGVR